MAHIKESKTFRIIISILAAFTIWLYVDLVDTAPRDVTVNHAPVVFTGESTVLMERGLMMAGSSTQTVDLVLSGTKSILAKLNTEDIYLQVDLTGIVASGQHSLNYEIIYPDSITKNMISVKSASVQRITVDIVELYTKSITVKGERSGSVAEGYMAGEMTFDTDTIVVSGEQVAVSNISHALVTVDIADAVENIVTVTEFQLIDFNGNVVDRSQFRTNIDTIQVTVPIMKIKELPLKVEFIESPGSMLSDVEWSMSVDSVTVAGTKASIAQLDEILLTKIDLSTITQDTTFTVDIPIPSGATNLSGDLQAEITIKFKEGIATRTFTVTNLATTHEPAGYTVELVTNEMDVTLRGPVEQLETVSDYNIRIVGDMADIEGGSGSFAVPATIFVDGATDVGAVGIYQMTVQMREAA